MLSTDTWLRIISGILINAVVFGIGAVTVLSVPMLSAHAVYLIPAVVFVSFTLAPFLSVWIAPRMRMRNWGGKKEWNQGDLISG